MSEEKGQEATESNAGIANHGDEAQRMLRQLADHVGQHKDLPASRKQAIGSLANNLDEQIALTKSASRETLHSARSQLRDGVRKMHVELNGALVEAEAATDHLLRSSVLAWTHAVEKLEKALAAGDKKS
jgi:hypothetical protein